MFLHRPDAQGSPIETVGLMDAEMGDVEMAARKDAGQGRESREDELARLRRENEQLRVHNLALSEMMVKVLGEKMKP